MEALIGRLSFKVWMVVMIVAIVTVLFTLYVVNERRAIQDAEVRAARNLVLMAESVRENMTQKWELGLFSTQKLLEIQATESDPSIRKQKILAAVPVVAAWESAKAKAEEGGFQFRTPRDNARNRNNLPDAIEQEALAYFQANSDAREHVIIDSDQNAIRYFRPVRLSQVCMNCHGDPARSQELWGTSNGMDITGFRMDNKKVGDLHGAFEVIKPLDDADALVLSTVLWGILWVVPLLLLVLWLVQRIAKQLFIQPLADAGDICRRIADGDLCEDIPAGGKDEIGRLMGALRQMRDHLNELITQVRSNTDEVSRASSEIAEGNSALSSRTEQQAASLEQTAASMNEMAMTVEQNAENTKRARTMIDDARERAIEGQSVSQEAVAAMTAINEASQRIEDIIGVINEIAFQTNLLALNAAVEAARAGEQGRGFAVVASEVRVLAGRSAEAAREIKSLIEDSVARVGQGTELVSRTGESLTEISQSVSEVATTIREIAMASDEQSQGIGQVNTAVSEMDTMTQANAALVEEATASAVHLEEMARTLSSLVARFQTREQTTNRPALGSVQPSLAGRATEHASPAQRSVPKAQAKPAAVKPIARIQTPRPPTQPIKPAASHDDWDEF